MSSIYRLIFKKQNVIQLNFLFPPQLKMIKKSVCVFHIDMLSFKSSLGFYMEVFEPCL